MLVAVNHENLTVCLRVCIRCLRRVAVYMQQ